MFSGHKKSASFTAKEQIRWQEKMAVKLGYSYSRSLFVKEVFRKGNEA